MFTLTVIGFPDALYTTQTLSLIKLLSNNHLERKNIFDVRNPLNLEDVDHSCLDQDKIQIFYI